MSKTKIEWTNGGETWNPLAGCTEISPGCVRCYAATMAHRLAAMGQKKYIGTTKKLPSGKIAWTGNINTDEEALLIPLKRKKPTTWFVNSMSDLFHEDVPDEFIDQVFAVMALCPQHMFQCLTKRGERMETYCSTPNLANRIYQQVERWLDEGDSGFLGRAWDRCHNQATSDTTDGSPIYDWVQWRLPLPNVWLGISVENKQHGLPRIERLLRTPAAVRFLSIEPLLEALGDIRRHLYIKRSQHASNEWTGVKPRIDWVIVGGESGHGSRPMHPDWVRSIKDQCVAAGVPFFFKQWGEFVPVGKPEDADEVVQIGARSDLWVNFDGSTGEHKDWQCVGMNKVGKKAAGRLLDGREWNEMPKVKEMVRS